MEQFHPSLFIASFNMNGKGLSKNDALTWLHQINPSKCNSLSDLVIISLQECPSAPNSLHGETGENIPFIKTFSSCHSTMVDDEIHETIKSSLSTQYLVLADIAMGEPPSPGETEESSRFYGYIRLIIFAKKDTVAHLNRFGKIHQSPLLIPILSPVGKKRPRPNISIYPRNRSPDKGAVCVAIPALNILICSMHLCGTNAYLPEAHFDEIRFTELDIIAEDCETALSKYTPTGFDRALSYFKPILVGDLNFRVEIFPNPEDKIRGGKDFKAVNDVLEEGNLDSVQKLFSSYDRLFQHLSYLEKEGKGFDRESDAGIELKQLPKRVKDLLKVQDVFTQHNVTFPTFTFLVGEGEHCISSSSQSTRKYSEKRTPSWPDRILISKVLTEKYAIESCGAYHGITSSDHVPIFAVCSQDPLYAVDK